MRNERVNKRIILQCTFQEEVQFPCKFEVQCSHGLPVLTYVSIVRMIIIIFQEIIGLTENYMPMH